MDNAFLWRASSCTPLEDLGPKVWNALRSGLAQAGFDVTDYDSFGLIALRVSDDDHVGTAYLEVSDGGFRLRVVLERDQRAEDLAS